MKLVTKRFRKEISSNEEETVCPYCGTILHLDDIVVQCPSSCQRWYHAKCWEDNGNRCSTLGCTGEGAISTQESIVQEEDIIGQITILGEINGFSIDSGINRETDSPYEIFNPGHSTNSIDFTLNFWDIRISNWVNNNTIGKWYRATIQKRVLPSNQVLYYKYLKLGFAGYWVGLFSLTLILIFLVASIAN